METKPLDRIAFLELENISLKIQLKQQNIEALKRQQEAHEQTLNSTVEQLFAKEGLSPSEWVIDLSKAALVKRAQPLPVK